MPIRRVHRHSARAEEAALVPLLPLVPAAPCQVSAGWITRRRNCVTRHRTVPISMQEQPARNRDAPPEEPVAEGEITCASRTIRRRITATTY